MAPDHTQLPLPLRLLLVTRPQPQADDWAQRLRALGQPATALPLLDIAPPADPQALLSAWPALSRYALVVFVSPAAVARFFAQRPPDATWPAGTWAGATGPGSVQALRLAGVPQVALVSPPADATQFDSEALWQQLRSLRPWAGAQVLVVRGNGGRDWLADTLRHQGALVHFVEAYRRTAPVLTGDAAAMLAAALARPQQHAWLLSSSEAAGNLHALAPQADLGLSLAIATHPRIAQRAQQLGFGEVLCVAPQPEAVAAALQP